MVLEEANEWKQSFPGGVEHEGRTLSIINPKGKITPTQHLPLCTAHTSHPEQNQTTNVAVPDSHLSANPLCLMAPSQVEAEV